MDLSLTIKEAALDILSWLAVDEGSATVTLESEGADTHYRVDIAASDAPVLIGKHGDTLAALQHALRILVAKRNPDEAAKASITVDVDGYLKRKIESTLELAARRAERVTQVGGEERLPPMTAAFRRAVHLFIAEKFPTLTTESVGFGQFKVLVIKTK